MAITTTEKMEMLHRLLQTVRAAEAAASLAKQALNEAINDLTETDDEDTAIAELAVARGIQEGEQGNQDAMTAYIGLNNLLVD